MRTTFTVSTSTLRTIASTVAALVTIFLSTAAQAQGFHIESAPRASGKPAIEGYVYNERSDWLSDVRVRVEVLDADGITVQEAIGWVSGNLGPRGRGYFVVPLKRLGTTYRVSVYSFNRVPQGGI